MKQTLQTYLFQHTIKIRHLHIEFWNLENQNIKEKLTINRALYWDPVNVYRMEGHSANAFAGMVLSYTSDVHSSSMSVFQLLTFFFLSNVARD